ncbi:MAG: efflux transporter periplasmic adaptor subunit [Acidobacteria bacterium]|nr:MAG: efflux transporter periplasmic adaptor subunit [Acidobacteriota bacterium]
MASTVNNTGFFSRRPWIIWGVGIIVAVILLASFMSRDDSVTVRAAKAERGTIRSLISTNGKIEPVQNFEAHSPIGTTIKKVLAKEGDHVKKGQLLLQLNDAEARSQAARALSQVRGAQANTSAIESGGNREEVLNIESQVMKARADRDAAQRNLEALRRLQQKGAASPGEVKDAENQLTRADADLKFLQGAQRVEAQAAYAAAQDVLSRLNVRAPFDGVVYSLPVRQGAYVGPGDLVLQMADLSHVLVRAYVDEPDVGRLSPGQKIEITWDAVPGRVWEGKVDVVPASVKLRGTRNVGETTTVVDNHDFKLLPNINVGVTIVAAEHRNVITVPREAIRQDSNTFVFEIANGRLVRRDVQVSISNLTQVEITAGLTDNALLALGSTNSKPLKNGADVKLVR